MEYADAGDLLGRINQHKRSRTCFTEEELWSYILQLLRGLKKLHSLRILHRDIKSANVFVCKDGTAKIGDLNVSKINKKGLAYTQTGTPYYASPEVWKDQPYDSKSDIWSVGCVIYEAASLNPPFKGNSMDELFKKVVRGQYPPLPELYSEDLHNIVRCLLQVAPSLRPSAEQLLQMPLVLRHENRSCKFEATTQGGLLGTIEVPRNISHLSARLPSPKYTRRRESSVPATRASESALQIPQHPAKHRDQSHISPEVPRKRLRAYGMDVVNRQPPRERPPLLPISRDNVLPRGNYPVSVGNRAEEYQGCAKYQQGSLSSRAEALQPRGPDRVPKWWG
jgi:NIMA (never in mitosis gene a)-related kinase